MIVLAQLRQGNLQAVGRKFSGSEMLDYWQFGVVECCFNMARFQGPGIDLIQRVMVQIQQEFHLHQDLYTCILVVRDGIAMLRRIFHS